MTQSQGLRRNTDVSTLRRRILYPIPIPRQQHTRILPKRRASKRREKNKKSLLDVALTVVVPALLIIIGAMAIEVGRDSVPTRRVVTDVALALVVVERVQVRLRDLRSDTGVAVVGGVGCAGPARWSTGHRSEDGMGQGGSKESAYGCG